MTSPPSVSDLVARLRELWSHWPMDAGWMSTGKILEQAAAEIERLTRENQQMIKLMSTAGLIKAQEEHSALRDECKRLRAALERIAKLQGKRSDQLLMDALSIAREALRGAGEKA